MPISGDQFFAAGQWVGHSSRWTGSGEIRSDSDFRNERVRDEQKPMLVTPEANQRNRIFALVLVGALAVVFVAAGWFWLPALIFVGSCPIMYWMLRRRCVRRIRTMEQPFPQQWEQTLESRVDFFTALSADEKERFRQLVKIFLSEVRVTGIGTEIDDTIRVLVAASAAIPIFGFRDWEYHRLGEVLVYPDSFGEEYQASDRAESNILGLTGVHQLRGVMILSKPSLLAGFQTASGRNNVGIHEFAHLVEIEELENGPPSEVSWEAVDHWVRYVARELSHPKNPASVRGYGYTNEHEFFAVLAEYFFKSPKSLEKMDPELYRTLEDMFHQDPASLLKFGSLRRGKVGKNAPCPCGSGEKYSRCCLKRSVKTKSGDAIDRNTVELSNGKRDFIDGDTPIKMPSGGNQL
ncbi:MAG: zinc-dependent peptidase [Acidobacteriota bacterium]